MESCFQNSKEWVKIMEKKNVRTQRGKVWLAGAGPGSGDLLTVKTERLLQEADCIVYDRLVGQEVLGLIPSDTEKIDVGKSPGCHASSQEEINQILVREAKQGKKVLRLKGGDPFLFGRGGEEAQALKREGIAFEVVPGISSALAVPAYQGIPVTHRDYVSSVHIITGHRKTGHRKAGEGPTPQEQEIPYEALVKAGGTFIFLMGVGALEPIMEGLMLAGMDKKVPAAVLQQGTMAGQKKIVATVETLAQKARDSGIKAPSVILVGEVCSLSEDLKWYENLPLFGKKIVITRPKERGCELQEQLKALGAEVLSVPTIQTAPLKEEAKIRAVQAELKRLGQYQVLVFTSPYGVERFFTLLLENGKDIRSLSHMKFAAIGQGTAKALLEKGIRADYMPKSYDGSSLGKLLAEKLADGTKILLARSSIGTKEILRELQKNPSLSFTDLPIYDTKIGMDNAKLLREFMEDGTVSYVVFTSSSTVEGFCRMLGEFPYQTVNAVCIGKKTEETAKKAGMETVTAENATAEDLVNCFWKEN